MKQRFLQNMRDWDVICPRQPVQEKQTFLMQLNCIVWGVRWKRKIYASFPMQKKQKNSEVNCRTTLSHVAWLKEVEFELESVIIRDNVEITKEDVTLQLRKMLNWKASRLDGIQLFWFKRCTSQHQRLTEHLNWNI